MMFYNWWHVSRLLTVTSAVLYVNSFCWQNISAQTQPARQTSGWQSSSPGRDSANLTTRLSPSVATPHAEEARLDSRAGTPAVQTAYYQAQGSLSDGLPQYPGQVAQIATQPAAQPPLPNHNVNNGSSSVGMVIPPALPNSMVSPPPPQTASSDLRPPQVDRVLNQTAPGLPQNQAAPPNQASPSRTATNQPLQQSTLPTGQGIRPNAQPVTSGYPFVTPAPFTSASRGNYATSPYQPAVFQTPYQTRPVPVQYASSNAAAPAATLAAAQQQFAAQQPAAVIPPALAPAAVPPSQYLTPQQLALPQYQYPQAGIIQTAYQCTPPGPTVPSTGAVPGTYLPPTLPPNLTPGLYTPNNSGYTPLFSLGQENYNVQLGRGIIGQPTVYVAGQPIRNFMRYLSP
jgi:hypothetical protein